MNPKLYRIFLEEKAHFGKQDIKVVSDPLKA